MVTLNVNDSGALNQVVEGEPVPIQILMKVATNLSTGLL